MKSLRHAFRQLTLHAGLSAVVVKMLAVGIGGTTALFAVFYEVQLKPLPVLAPAELVNLRSPGEKPGNNRPGPAMSDVAATFSYPMFRDLEADESAGLAAHYDFTAQLTQDTQTAGGRGVLVSGRYFDVLGLQPVIRRTRAEPAIEKRRPPRDAAAWCHEAFVRAHDLGAAPVGQVVQVAGPFVKSAVQVVGVVGDARYSSLKGPILPQLFTPRVPADKTFAVRFFYVRTDADPDSLVARIPRMLAEIDPSLPVSNLATLAQRTRDNLWGDRLIASLSTSFAALATLLTAIGLYGVLSYNIARRTRELGLRLALGAAPHRLLIGVLKQVVKMALTGIGIGLLLAVALGRVLGGMLYGLSGYDPLVLATVVIVIGAVVLAASYAPARRASSIEPMQALRNE